MIKRYKIQCCTCKRCKTIRAADRHDALRETRKAGWHDVSAVGLITGIVHEMYFYCPECEPQAFMQGSFA